jgi:hypothetical protein
MINGTVFMPIGPMASGEGKDQYSSTLPIDLTPVDESNTISRMMLDR